jgi:hypothetical protein
MRHGTWQETGSSSPGPHLVILAIIAAALLGSGAAAAVATAVVIAVIAFGALVALVTIGLTALVIWRVRAEHRQAPVLLRQLPAAAPPAVEAAGPRELHQHWHFHGTEPQQLAEILRRGQERPE